MNEYVNGINKLTPSGGNGLRKSLREPIEGNFESVFHIFFDGEKEYMSVTYKNVKNFNEVCVQN